MDARGTSEVAIVGGGVLGSAIAFWLARAGVGVRLFEAGAAGAEGANRHTGGMLRSLDFDPVLMRLSMAGTALMNDWAGCGLPGPSPVTAAPLWWLVDDAAADHFEALCREHPPLGRLVHRVRTARAAPAVLRGAAAPWALHDPSGGVTDARLAVRQLLHDAVRHGAEVFEHCPVAIAPADEGAPGTLQLSSATGLPVAAGWTVLATGAAVSAQQLGAGGGWERRSVPQVQLCGLPAGLPCVIDQPSGTYLRPLGPGRACLGWPGRLLAAGPPPPPDEAEAGRRIEAMCRSLGLQAMPQAVGHLVGTDAYTADGRPRVEWREAARTCLATGLSGRGFKYGLLLGAAIAQALCRRLGRGHRSALPAACAEVDGLLHPASPVVPEPEPATA